MTLTVDELDIENMKMAARWFGRNLKNLKLFDLDFGQQIMVFSNYKLYGKLFHNLEKAAIKERTAGYTFLSRSISNRFPDFQFSKLKSHENE